VTATDRINNVAGFCFTYLFSEEKMIVVENYDGNTRGYVNESKLSRIFDILDRYYVITCHTELVSGRFCLKYDNFKVKEAEITRFSLVVCKMLQQASFCRSALRLPDSPLRNLPGGFYASNYLATDSNKFNMNRTTACATPFVLYIKMDADTPINQLVMTVHWSLKHLRRSTCCGREENRK